MKIENFFLISQSVAKTSVAKRFENQSRKVWGVCNSVIKMLWHFILLLLPLLSWLETNNEVGVAAAQLWRNSFPVSLTPIKTPTKVEEKSRRRRLSWESTRRSRSKNEEMTRPFLCQTRDDDEDDKIQKTKTPFSAKQDWQMHRGDHHCFGRKFAKIWKIANIWQICWKQKHAYDNTALGPSENRLLVQ